MREISINHSQIFAYLAKFHYLLAFKYSLEESCKMNGLDFGTYIEYVMERMVAGEKDARSLLPNRVTIPTDWIPESQMDCPSQQKTA